MNSLRTMLAARGSVLALGLLAVSLLFVLDAWRGKPAPPAAAPVQTSAPAASVPAPTVTPDAAGAQLATQLQQRAPAVAQARRAAAVTEQRYETVRTAPLPVQSGPGDLPARLRRTCAKFAELGIHCAEPAASPDAIKQDKLYL